MAAHVQGPGRGHAARRGWTGSLGRWAAASIDAGLIELASATIGWQASKGRWTTLGGGATLVEGTRATRQKETGGESCGLPGGRRQFHHPRDCRLDGASLTFLDGG